MIAKAIIGAIFGGCVRYCLDEKKDPEILESNGIYGDSIMGITKQFNAIRDLKPAVKNAVWHSTISWAHSDKVDNPLMVKVAKDFLKEMKLLDNQYVMVKHNDTKHNHLHIIINRVGFDGAVARDWKSGYRSKKVMQELEKKHDLTVAVDQGNKRKEEIANQLDIGLSKKENLTQLWNRIENLGYKVVPNKTSKGNIRGVSFIHEKSGISFKSSGINRKYSYSKLVVATTKKSIKFKSKSISL